MISSASADLVPLHIAFLRAHGFLSRAIEWFGGDYYSHSAIRLPSDPAHVIDARADEIVVPVLGHAGEYRRIAPGVKRRPVEYLTQGGLVPDWFRIEVEPDRALAVESALVSQLDKPYDFSAIWAFALGRLTDRNWRDRRAWFCSELDAWAFEQGGVLDPITF